MSAERRIHLSDLWPPGDLARLAVPASMHWSGVTRVVGGGGGGGMGALSWSLPEPRVVAEELLCDERVVADA